MHSNTAVYKIILTAEAVRRLTHPYDPKMILTNLAAPTANFTFRGENQGAASDSVTFRTKIGHWDLADHQRKKIELVNLMDGKHAPIFELGIMVLVPLTTGCGTFVKSIIPTSNFGENMSHAWHVIGKNPVLGRIVLDVCSGPVVRLL